MMPHTSLTTMPNIMQNTTNREHGVQLKLPNHIRFKLVNKQTN